MRAGIDRREQKKASAAYESAVLAKQRSAAGVETTEGDRAADAARKRAADKYDGFDMSVGGGGPTYWWESQAVWAVGAHMGG
jgi:hypothetical protein